MQKRAAAPQTSQGFNFEENDGSIEAKKVLITKIRLLANDKKKSRRIFRQQIDKVKSLFFYK